MCKAIEQIRNESWDEAWGKAWGEATHVNAVAIAKNLLELGKLTSEEIAAVSGLSIEDIKALAGEKSA